MKQIVILSCRVLICLRVLNKISARFLIQIISSSQMHVFQFTLKSHYLIIQRLNSHFFNRTFKMFFAVSTFRVLHNWMAKQTLEYPLSASYLLNSVRVFCMGFCIRQSITLKIKCSIPLSQNPFQRATLLWFKQVTGFANCRRLFSVAQLEQF